MSSRKAIWTLAGYLAGAVLLWSGCTDEIHPEPGGDEEATRIFASISVQQPGGKAASTRGVLDPDDDEYELGITEAELYFKTEHPDDIPALLESRDRRRAPFTAPPQGLTMTQIWYDGEPRPEGWVGGD